MSLLASIITIWSGAVGTASGLQELRRYLSQRVEIEKVLAGLIHDGFRLQLPRLSHLCPDGEPMFHAEQFAEELSGRQLGVHTADDLLPQLLPLLEENVSTPGATCGEEVFRPVYESILNSALRGMWKKIGSYESLATEILLQQNDEILSQQRRLSDQVDRRIGTVENNLGTAFQNLAVEIKSLAGFAQLAWKQPYEKLLDSAPPHEHKIDNELNCTLD